LNQPSVTLNRMHRTHWNERVTKIRKEKDWQRLSGEQTMLAVDAYLTALELEHERIMAIVEAAVALDKAVWEYSSYWVNDANLDIGMLLADEMVALREALAKT
jgi:hypothetical protein